MTTLAQRWALAPAAIIIRYNLEDPELLGGMPAGEASASDARDQLDGWDVASATHARDVLAGLAQGKRKLTQKQQRFAARHGLGERGFLAYDLCSIPHVAGLSYLAGFLDEDAAWQTCFAAARRTQATFASWEALGRECLLGWDCFDGKDPALRHVYRALVLEKHGPWSIPWDTPLA